MKKQIIDDQRGIAHILLILLAVIVLGGVGYVGWRSYSANQKKTISPSSTNTSDNQNGASGSKSTPVVGEKTIQGTWVTECLVPVINNKWAEKHQFVIEGEKAIHTRWSDDSGANNCNTPNMTAVDKYTYTVPSAGKINFNNTETGITFYDMFKVQSTTLMFGHGFRRDYAGSNLIVGDSDSTRIDTLNTYLVYKKK